MCLVGSSCTAMQAHVEAMHVQDWNPIVGFGADISFHLCSCLTENDSHACRPAVIISYVLAGLAAFLSGLCYIEYVVETPLTGGAFNYMWLTFGELAAW